MRCLPCFQAQKSITDYPKPDHGPSGQEFTDPGTKNQNPRDGIDQVAMDNTSATTFTFRELATATRNFRHEFLLSEGGFGRVFKGTLASNGQVVAVKKLDRSGMNGNQEFLREISKLSLLHHPNLVNLIGYCADGDQRLLVYEYMPAGSLENHLRCTLLDQKPLDWFTRMRVALGTAKGLEYLHNQASPPIIYRDLKPSNILLDEHCNPKLCDYGLAKLPRGDSMFVPSRVVGTYGYCAPEYARSGQLTLKSDVYCFGVILLELITGRRALDTTRPMNEQNLVAWAQPMFKDPKRFPDMADPLLKRRFPEKDLNQAVAIAAMCLQEEPAARPLMSDVVTTLIFLSVATEESLPLSTPPLEDDAIKDDDDQCETEAGDSSGDEDNSSESNDYEDSSSDEDSEQEHDFYASDSQDEDGVCEHQQTDSESKRRRKSSMKSINESVSASQKSSKKSRSRRVSLRQKSSSVTDNGSVSSGDDSSRGSIKENALLNKESSKNSQRNQKGSLRLKSRKNSTKAFLSHKSSIHSLFSLKHGSSKGSTEGSVSPSHLGSGRSQNYEGSFSSSSSGELAMESDISSLTSESKS